MPIDREKATLALDGPVNRVRLVSPARAKALEKLGVRTLRDLLTHFPRSYVDLSSVETCASARIGETCTVRGTVHEIKLKKPRYNLKLVEIAVTDGTGILIVTAFRQPWLMDQIKAGDAVAVAGKVTFDYGYKRMTNPFIEVIGEGEGITGAVVPVHPATEKLSAAWVRRIVANGLEEAEGAFDPLPLGLRLRYRLMSRNAALRAIHFPQSMAEVAEARRRLVYEEVLYLELFLMQEGAERSRGAHPVAHVTDGPRVAAFAAQLPFALTGEQERARDEILEGMAAPSALNHMLLGDVGTGKTVVAGFALAAAADTGGQAMLLAPTEVLARQHAEGLGALLAGAGVTCALLTGSTPAAERASITERFAAGDLDVLIGTHALLSEDVTPARLTLAVIDEQQRFGVDQRTRLLAKGEAPDALYLTATPIPRTLALALYGNLTLSYIKHRPHDAVSRTTRVLRRELAGDAFDAASAALARGEQVYVVCPLVGKGSEERDEKAAGKRPDADAAGEEYHPAVAIEDADDFDDDVTAATREAEMLQRNTFPDYTVELLHGGMGTEAKREVMERFRAGEVQVLVATTVIEVGVDVPNATVMIVEDADRFGLAQLHQLRGRVGRGTKAAEVYLLSASTREESLARLAAMETTDDGFELAAFDLSLRREGDILGNRQHGASGLKLVNIMRDGAVIEAAHADAAALLDVDPDLEEPDHRAMAREVRLAFAGEAVGG
ncbi:ATP-dependent DNA helicase RecG [uncultured Adlercreutzia sp.]|uniref:ATP-dependent DNA helicase RecG n=1 Tax=uncultured Adlercreutzia sp. TaxID=875803 RepID=UPI00267708EC|nr:ATP-dependent DNA helicase RecG [uncultured Adlercreutzia sp.]